MGDKFIQSVHFETLGGMKEIHLTKKNFDVYFKDIDGISGWKDSYSASKIRRDNENAWELIRKNDSSAMSYYLLKQKNGEVYLACWYPYEDDVSKNHVRWLFRLKNIVERQEVEQGTYIIKSCIYMNPLSSYMPIGDMQETFEVGDGSFTIINKATNHSSYIEARLEWQEFPYTDEEWHSLYYFGLEESAIKEISKLCDDIGYIPLAEGCCLLRLNEALWLVKINHDGVAGIDYIWSIYRIERVNATNEKEIPYIK